jgi:hypothetical protein
MPIQKLILLNYKTLLCQAGTWAGGKFVKTRWIFVNLNTELDTKKSYERASSRDEPV